MLHRPAPLLLAILAGCSAPSDTGPDGGAPPDAIAIDATGTDAPIDPALDGSIPADGGSACVPSPGPTRADATCDLFELALFGTGSAREARLFGRVSAGEGCTVIDEVEVREGDDVVATLEGAGPFASGDPRALLARGPAVGAMTDRCAMEDRRFGGFGLVVRGRMDGGSFEAACADAEGGGRWPPALRITCHDGVDDRPLSAYASVSSFMGFTFSTLDVSVPHGEGGALTGADTRVRVIPTAYSLPFGPPPPMLMPFDSEGWTATVSESSPGAIPVLSQLHLTTDRAALTTDLCPPPRTGPPDPMEPPPPVFLARITGTGERGAFSTEAYVEYCTTTSM